MTEKESAHANFADFAGVDESEPMGNNEDDVASNSAPIPIAVGRKTNFKFSAL